MAQETEETEVTLDYYNDEGERIKYTQEIPYGKIIKLIELMDSLAAGEDADEDEQEGSYGG